MSPVWIRQQDAYTPGEAGIRMVKLSTVVILVGVVFLFIPIPPIATIIGIVTILAGVAMRILGGS